MEVCEPIKMSPKKNDLASPNATSKCLKQVRLPFKQLDVTVVSPVSGTSGKKRKLSSGEISVSKITKTTSGVASKSSNKLNFPVKSDENEVSSSSEAENLPVQDGRKSKPRIIEKLIEAAQQREVSTSGEVIDLASEYLDDEGDISGVTVQDVDAAADATKNETGLSNTCTEHVSDVDMDVVEIVPDETKLKGDSASSEKGTAVVPNESLKESTPKRDGFFAVAIKKPSSVKHATDEMVTPAKVRKTSEKQIPGTSGSPGAITSPGSSSAQVIVTQTSTKKAASLKKKQEKELEKQKKKEEKEREKVEKQKQRDEAKAEKERKKQEEKEKKEQERLQKEREKQEKKEQAERERLEKVKQKEDERKKKLEAVEEEKRKKEEEKKKKEDEKRQKEDEKKRLEDEKNAKAQKAKAAFTNFFIKTETSPTSSKPANKEDTGLFREFYVNKDVTVAPSTRARAEFDGFDSKLELQNSHTLYLEELRNGCRKPKRTRTLKNSVLNGDDEVMVVADESMTDDVNSENTRWPKIMKTKFLKFKDNYRPAYRGTWRKKTSVLTPKNPFKMDKDLFDYEYDSDDDWVEEEPGESLSNSEGEGDDEDEKNDGDDDDDGFFVPHGYLSENEGCDEDEEEVGNYEKMKVMQIAKAKAFEMELKRKCEVMTAVVIGCCWMDATNQIPEVYNRLQAYKAVPLSSTPIATACSKEKTDYDAKRKAKARGIQKKPVPQEAMPDLIKYIHGNILGLKKLVKGFRMLWHNKTNHSAPDATQPVQTDTQVNDPQPAADNDSKMEVESPISDKIPESELEISKRQLEMKVTAIAAYKKGPQHYRKCWYVNNETLKEYNLEKLLEKVVKKKELNKSTDGSQAHCATPEAATPKQAKTTPSVTITQFTVKADPDAKWHIEKPAPKPAPVTPGPATPSPVVASPATSKAPARRIQLTTLTNFMKPKPVKSSSPDEAAKASPVQPGEKKPRAVCTTRDILVPKESQCQIIDLTDDGSNDAPGPRCSQSTECSMPVASDTSLNASISTTDGTRTGSTDVEMADADDVIVLE